MSHITMHILDTTAGLPAQSVPVSLSAQIGDTWEEIAQGETDADGRITDLLPDEQILNPGLYKIYFATETYFSRADIDTFYPYVEIVFRIVDPDQHYHIPLLLSPYGYTTYRGS